MPKDTGTNYCDETCVDAAAGVADVEDDVGPGTSADRSTADNALADLCSDRYSNRTPAIRARQIVPEEDTGSSRCVAVRASSGRPPRSSRSTKWSCCRSRWCWRWRCRRSPWFRRFQNCPEFETAPRCNCARNVAFRSSWALCLREKSAMPFANVLRRRSACAFCDARGHLPLSAGFSLASVPVCGIDIERLDS